MSGLLKRCYRGMSDSLFSFSSTAPQNSTAFLRILWRGMKFCRLWKTVGLTNEPNQKPRMLPLWNGKFLDWCLLPTLLYVYKAALCVCLLITWERVGQLSSNYQGSSGTPRRQFPHFCIETVSWAFRSYPDNLKTIALPVPKL